MIRSRPSESPVNSRFPRKVRPPSKNVSWPVGEGTENSRVSRNPPMPAVPTASR